MAKKQYTQSELSYACSQLKREILNKIKKGTLTKISKTQALSLVARKLNLASERTLWKGDTGEYLDSWYKKLDADIKKSINEKNKTTNASKSSVVEVTLTDEPSDDKVSVNQKLDDALKLIKTLEEALRVVRIENNKLREALITKYGKMDSEINNESVEVLITNHEKIESQMAN